MLLLSQVIEATHALALVSESAEGFGYLLKDRVLEIDDFLDAVRRVGRGGTAIDAVVAAGFAMAVTHPTAGNIGGGGFIVYRTAAGASAESDPRVAAILSGFEKFLEGVAKRDSKTASQMWVATTYLSLGSGSGSGSSSISGVTLPAAISRSVGRIQRSSTSSEKM